MHPFCVGRLNEYTGRFLVTAVNNKPFFQGQFGSKATIVECYFLLWTTLGSFSYFSALLGIQAAFDEGFCFVDGSSEDVLVFYVLNLPFISLLGLHFFCSFLCTEHFVFISSRN